jgi:hypothetical protein
MQHRNRNLGNGNAWPVLAFLMSIFLALAAAPASAQQFCAANTTCRASAHTTLAQGTYPYTEDIDGSSGGVVLTGPASAFTTLETSCSQLPGNLNGSASFNATLRAQLTLEPDSTAAVGSHYEVQLLVDGVEHGWYTRSLRGQYPQADVFAATIQNVPAGNLLRRVSSTRGPCT